VLRNMAILYRKRIGGLSKARYKGAIYAFSEALCITQALAFKTLNTYAQPYSLNYNF
jgi:hypothetical protein